MVTPLDGKYMKRLNLMIGEPLFRWAAKTADARGQSVSEFVRTAVEKECARAEDDLIAAAADRLAGLYERDEELTAFQALDAEEPQ
jgi:hypothetical protein